MIDYSNIKTQSRSSGIRGEFKVKKASFLYFVFFLSEFKFIIKILECLLKKKTTLRNVQVRR